MEVETKLVDKPHRCIHDQHIWWSKIWHCGQKEGDTLGESPNTALVYRN